MKIDINPAECYGCEYLDGDDWRCTAGECADEWSEE